MAKRRNSEAGNGVDHIEGEAPEGEAPLNSAARADIIRDAHAEIGEFERQIAGLKAEVKAIIETRIVAGLGMNKRDFALARKLVEVDQSERDGTFDALREVFNALDVGVQLDWVSALAEGGAGAVD